MARKRLTPPQESYLSPAPPGSRDLPGPFSSAPIARIAGDASAVAAMRELSEELRSAREDGRLVQDLALTAIEADHLIRDRVASDPEEMAALKDSLRARGQQQPIDVVDLGEGRYGLISGWRRLKALQELLEETGETRFATVQALLRRPDSASTAYLSMVEENEIRAGLSHYERARIAAKAAEQGVFETDQAALRALFANASRAKRSKIGSFITIHRALGAALAFPAAIPERLGLALAQALEADADLAVRLSADLAAHPPGSAEEELARLSKALNPLKTDPDKAKTGEKMSKESGKNIHLWASREPTGGLRVTLTGSGLSERLVKRLASWLAKQD